MNNKSIFAKNLKHQMDLHQKTRKEICEALGFSYYTFSDWVNGKKYPRMDKVELLADYFGILKSDLIEEKNEKPTENDGLPNSIMELIEVVKSLPEEDAVLLLAALKAKQKQ